MANYHDKMQMYKKQFLKNVNYIEWLCEFLLKHNCFTDDEWGVSSIEISKKDNEYVRYLGFFYEIIGDFFRKNNLSPVYDGENIIYRIVHNGCAFEIGLKPTPTTYFFCRKCEYKINMGFLDYDDIRLDKKPKCDEYRKEQLKEVLSIVIGNVIRNGLTPEEIINLVNEFNVDHKSPYSKKI